MSISLDLGDALRKNGTPQNLHRAPPVASRFSPPYTSQPHGGRPPFPRPPPSESLRLGKEVPAVQHSDQAWTRDTDQDQMVCLPRGIRGAWARFGSPPERKKLPERQRTLSFTYRVDKFFEPIL